MRRAARAAILLLALPAAEARAQGVRISGATTARYVALQPIRVDSVPASELEGTGPLRRGADGRVYRCGGDAWCRTFVAGERVSSVPILQDVEATAWGFGEGVRLYAHVRGRTGLGEVEGLWPQSERGVELLAGYAEIEREKITARLGRQWLTSGLGFYNYDGAALEYRPLASVAAELYGGMSLVRGLNQTHGGDVLEAVEDIVPDERAWLLGARVRVRPWPGVALSGFYQREARTDEAALYSERVAVDARAGVGRTSVVGALEADLATGELNEARLRADFPLGGSFAGTLEARRYLPFFELWTIWGAFDPVGFDEASAALAWGVGRPVTLRVRGAWRGYDDTGTGVGFLPLRDDGWRLSADAAWRASERWSFLGDYRAEIGFGAARSEGALGARLDLGDRAHLGVHALAFQMVEEFRVEEGTVAGIGGDGSLRIGPDMRLVGSLVAYRHFDDDDSDTTVDWTQLRGLLRLDWTLGRDPGEVR